MVKALSGELPGGASTFQATASRLQMTKARDAVLLPGQSQPLTPRPPQPVARPASAAPRPNSAAPSTVISYPARPATARTSQPEILSKLLYFVRHELQNAEAPAGSDAHVHERLDVFRRAFGHFIASFGAYSPLLLAVQQAYEDALTRAEDRAASVDSMRERLELMRDETSQLLEARHEQLRQDAAFMTDAIAAREQKMAETERALRRTQIELGTARTELGRAHRLTADADARCIDLSTQLEHWRDEAQQAKLVTMENTNEVKELRGKLSQHVQRDLLQAYEEQERAQEVKELRDELSDLRDNSVPKRELVLAQEQLRLTKDKHRKADAEARELARVLSGGEAAGTFPDGLDWANEDEELRGVAFLDEGWKGKRVGQVVASVVGDMVSLRAQLAAARAREEQLAALLAQAYAAAADAVRNVEQVLLEG